MFDRPAPLELRSVIEDSRSLLVLDDLVDHENVGTLMRTAAGLGVDAVILTETSADPLYRRSIKTSMGAVFAIPWTRSGSSHDVLTILREHDVHQLALTPRGETVLGQQRFDRRPVAMWLGNEGRGLSEEVLSSVDERVAIPMNRDTDSINVAAAGAVALWEILARNSNVEESR